MPKTNKATTVKEDTEVKEVARKVTGKVVNPRDVQFPFDSHGFTSMLRKEGVRAVGRIKGDEAKLDVLVSTLRVIAEHANVKVKDQRKVAEQSRQAAQNRVDAEYSRSLEDHKAQVKRAEDNLKAAEAALEAKLAVPGEE